MKKLYLLVAAALCAATATAANGDVTDGWLMLEDFEGANPEVSVVNPDNGNEGQGTMEIAKIAKDENQDNNALKFTPGSYGNGVQLKVTLPAGKTIADYKAFKIDIYTVDNSYKPFRLYINGKNLYEANAIINGKDKWIEHQHDIEVTGTGSEVVFYLYSHASNSSTFAFDNIQLKEKEGSGGEDPDPVDPTGPDATTNGTVTDGVLMVEDFQDKALGTECVWNMYGNAGEGTAAIAADPTKASNYVAELTCTNYDYYVEVDVTLPDSKTLKDYKNIIFDFYRYTDDDNYKMMLVYADNEKIYLDGGYIEQGKEGQWTRNKKYAIPTTIAAGNSFKLRLGLNGTNAGHYAIDNIRLLEREPELELIGEPVITIKHGTAAGTMTVSYSFEVKNHNGEEIKVVATVDGHDEVIFKEAAAEPENAPVRAPGENKTFSGNLKAQHDVLKTISNPMVKLIGTAGKKQLFAITKAPDTTTGIEDVTVDSEAPVEYFNLQGLRVAQPEAGQLYIKRQGDKAVKVRF